MKIKILVAVLIICAFLSLYEFEEINEIAKPAVAEHFHQFNSLKFKTTLNLEYYAADTINSDTPDCVLGFEGIVIIVNESNDGSYTLSVEGNRIVIPKYTVIRVNQDHTLEYKYLDRETFLYNSNVGIFETIERMKANQSEQDNPITRP